MDKQPPASTFYNTYRDMRKDICINIGTPIEPTHHRLKEPGPPSSSSSRCSSLTSQALRLTPIDQPQPKHAEAGEFQPRNAGQVGFKR